MNIPSNRNIAFSVRNKSEILYLSSLSIYKGCDFSLMLKPGIGWIYYDYEYDGNSKLGYDYIFGDGDDNALIEPSNYTDMDYLIIDVTKLLRNKKLERVLSYE